MKRILISFLCIVSIFACKKKKEDPDKEPLPVDNVAPVITLNGKQQDTVLVLNTYTDPGATATDDKDGNITSRIVVSGTVNTGIPGNNVLTYNVTDLAGNHAATVTRTVTVIIVNYIMNGAYMVACASNTQNPGVDPIITANSSYTSIVQLAGQTGTVVALTALNIGPVTGPTNQFGVNALIFSLPGSPVNAPNQTFAHCTGTVAASKTSFTIDTKYYETMTPNKFYEVRNVFTKQ